MKHAPLIAIFLLTACMSTAPSQTDIEEEIQQANYCDTVDDCTVLTGKCPFGCYITVNSSEAAHIELLMESFESTCVYSCVPVQPVSCENNKCVMQEMVPEKPVSNLPEGTFDFNDGGNFYGEVYLRGFLETGIVEEAFCEENCTEYEYAYFVPTEIGNANFEDFLEKNHGNSYINGPTIGIGCLEGDVISYENHSDERGMAQIEIDADTTNQLLNATEENPVVVKLTKLELSGGRGAPTCYGHFTEVELYEEPMEMTYDQNSWEDMIDDSCKSYFDGCNNCMRNDDNDLAACTKKFCQQYEKPQCLDNEL